MTLLIITKKIKKYKLVLKQIDQFLVVVNDQLVQLEQKKVLISNKITILEEMLEEFD
jgi:hypothetical protein